MTISIPENHVWISACLFLKTFFFDDVFGNKIYWPSGVISTSKQGILLSLSAGFNKTPSFSFFVYFAFFEVWLLEDDEAWFWLVNGGEGGGDSMTGWGMTRNFRPATLIMVCPSNGLGGGSFFAGCFCSFITWWTLGWEDCELEEIGSFLLLFVMETPDAGVWIGAGAFWRWRGGGTGIRLPVGSLSYQYKINIVFYALALC